MQVEARHDRHARPNRCAHAAQDLAFAVLVFLGHHGAVQVEVDAVHPARGFQVLDQAAQDPFESLRGDVRRRARRGPRGADQRVPHRAQRLDRTRSGNVGALHRSENGLAVLHAGPAPARLERRVVRLRGREGVGLVLKAANGNSTHSIRLMLGWNCPSGG